jgi:hypothetical protein
MALSFAESVGELTAKRRPLEGALCQRACVAYI